MLTKYALYIYFNIAFTSHIIASKLTGTLTGYVSPGGGGHGVTWKGKKKIQVIMHGNRRMVERIRPLTSYVSPGGGVHGRVSMKYT